ncbi:MAG: VanA-type vancomycin resistance histidine kinase VanS, partial [Clostridiales bacterium]|nr:VanA-type vancomycin resistance histidine kinase VanS [Clostridiales bacterium]
MKNKKRKPDYTALKWKVYFRMVILAAAAVVFVFTLRMLAQGRLANFIVDSLTDVFDYSRMQALDFYYTYIRRYIDVIVAGSAVGCFVFFCRFLMSYFSKYFNEISGGLDALVEDKEGEIKLSPEMLSMERKLNAINKTLKKRSQDARQAEQRKNELVTYLAHDIKTPLTSVIGYLSLLDESAELPERRKKEYVRITLDKAKRLERLLNELFEITRYNLLTITVTKEQIDLYYMLAQMADEFYPLLSAKGKRIALNAAEDLSVSGDPDKLARVFNNILRNAAEYSPDGSVIEITAASAGDTVKILFKNEGGVPEDRLESIFEKFYRLDTARSSSTGGAGLGLAIAKEIVLAHG